MTLFTENRKNRSEALTALPVTPVAMFLSCIFSAFVILQNPLLNDDAYGYLHAAEAFNVNGARAVLEAYNWPHYSILIALVDRVLPGSLLVAAHTFNTALYALLTWVFIELVGELRDTRRAERFAAACILGFPLINEMRYFLIRDIGFWAFALLSLVLLLRYRRNGELHLALGWCCALCAAAVFRLEALLLLVLAPLSLLFQGSELTPGQGLRRLAHLCGVTAAASAFVALVSALASLNLIELIAYAYRYYLPRLAEFFPLLTRSATDVGAALFTPENFPGSDNTLVAFLIVLFGDLLALLLNLVGALSVPVVVLTLGYHWKYGPLPLPKGGSRILFTYVGVTVVTLLVFLSIMHFLTQRYATLLALLVMSLVPLMLDDLYTRATQQGQGKQFRAIFGAFYFYFMVDSLFSFGYSHQHIEDSIDWAREELPAGARMQTNNFAIAYHSGRVTNYDKTVREIGSVVATSAPGDYLLLEVDHDTPASLMDTYSQLTSVTSFANERGDQVRVYLRQ